MSNLNAEKILNVLKSIIHPTKGKDIVSLNMVSGISIEGKKVTFSINIDENQGDKLENLRLSAQNIVEKIPNVTSARAILTSEKKAKTQKPRHPVSKRPVAPEVKHMIAVFSGKGGVGKSTFAANLAATFAGMGKKTGLLDADIYGASQPRMMGISQKPDTDKDEMIIPPIAHGIKTMSMGFFVEETSPVIWRGPMVHAAIQQLLRDVKWGDLDILIIDMPPGTGDAQLSIVQNVPLSGAIIISTPQKVALTEAQKGLFMFQKVNVPILGLVENMSYHFCNACGNRDDIFDHGKTKALAAELKLPFLGEIPLQTNIREAADKGTPFVEDQKEHIISETFKNIAARVWMDLGKKAKESMSN